MKFAHKLILGGPVHPCYEPLQALQQCINLYYGTNTTIYGAHSVSLILIDDIMHPITICWSTEVKINK